MNKFEFVAMSGQRAKQLLRGCTPKTEGPKKIARIAMKEIKEKKIEKVQAPNL